MISTPDKTKPDNTDWVYVVVQAPGKNEMFLGQHDDEADISFLPVYRNKDDANRCLPLMVRDPALNYEVQAVHKDDIYAQAAQMGFYLYLLDENGLILNKINPADDLAGK